MILENTSLFLDMEDAVQHLAERLTGKDSNDFLFVVLTKDAKPVADQIAMRLGISVTLSPAEENAEMAGAISMVSFDYSTIHNSGRDLPQDFIFHQEQNLRANLMFLYSDTYKSMATKFPGKTVILVDELSNNEDHISSLDQNSKQSERISLTVPTDAPASLNEISNPGKRFILLHAGKDDSANEIAQDFDIIIEEVVPELNEV